VDQDKSNSQVEKEAVEALELTGLLQQFFTDEEKKNFEAFKALSFNDKSEDLLGLIASTKALTSLQQRLLSYVERQQLIQYYKTRQGENNGTRPRPRPRRV